jgi:hypothetical protein
MNTERRLFIDEKDNTLIDIYGLVFRKEKIERAN